MVGQTFGELVADHRNNRSLNQLEDDSGGVVRWNSWQQWINPSPNRARVQFPQVDTIRGMARSLGVTEREVLLALGRTLGLSLEADEDLVVVGAGRLPPFAKATLQSLALTLMAAERSEA